MMARLRGVSRRAMFSAVRFIVQRSQSASTGFAPACRMAFTVEQKVIDEAMTSSSELRLSASRERCSAAVQDPTAIACGAPLYAAKLRSNCATLGPVPIHRLLSAATTAAISSSPIAGAPNTKKRLGARTGTPPSIAGRFDRFNFLTDVSRIPETAALSLPARASLVGITRLPNSATD
jgi:hypothetical protein